MNANIVIIISLLVLLLLLVIPTRMYLQRRYIKNYSFPNSIKLKISKHYPNLEKKQFNFILEGLKQFFIINNRANKKSVAMPSQAVDVAWHEFILHTKAYDSFCKKAVGRFLHHTPTEAMNSPTIAKIGIKRAWQLSCKEEKICSDNPLKLQYCLILMVNWRFLMDINTPQTVMVVAQQIWIIHFVQVT